MFGLSDTFVSFLFYILAVDYLPIVCKFKTFGQSAIGNIVSADVVGEVYEICSLCTYSTAESNSIINQLMAMVWFLKTESINNECVNIVKIIIFRLFYALHIGYVCETFGLFSENKP